MFMNPEDVSRAGKVTHRQGSSSLHGGWAGAGGTPHEREPGLRWVGAQSKDIGSWRGNGLENREDEKEQQLYHWCPSPRPAICVQLDPVSLGKGHV